MVSSSLTGSIFTWSRVVRLSVARARVPLLLETLAASLAACSFFRFLELDVCDAWDRCDGAEAAAAIGWSNFARNSAMACGDAVAIQWSMLAGVNTVVGGVLTVAEGVARVTAGVAVGAGVPAALAAVDAGSGDT